MASLIPKNSARFSLSEVARLCAGTLAGPDGECVGVATDTRSDLRGQLFVALSGEHFDGHEFVHQAVAEGARGVLVQHPVTGLSVGSVQVESTLSALGALAGAHRRRWAGRIVAIAGSAGKTTTRSAVTALLSALSPGRVHFAAGTLNNLIGVPLVLLGLTPEHSLGVVELGTNAPGEVRALSLMAAPDLAILTVIGIEHSEGLGDLDGIEREEGEIWTGLAEGGVALINADDPRVVRTLGRARGALRSSYGFASDADYRVLERAATSLGRTRLSVRRQPARRLDVLTLETPLLGEAGAYATLAALATAEWFHERALDSASVSAGLAAAGERGRLTPIALRDGTIVLDDSYNSNPESVRSSLSSARELSRAHSARLLIVLGEMRELGELSGAEHTKVGELVGQSGASVLIAVGGDAARFLPAAERAGVEVSFVETAELALAELLPRLRAKDLVLVKASRGVRAECVVQGLVTAKGLAG
jgi:UDP-N-acetylmuramoyl-tripeptide--D-alanyl-D-alanine ligase